MRSIPSFKLVAKPETEEAQRLPKFRWAADEVGTRHLLGGTPQPRIDESHWPLCPDCREKMTFYGQLDSINDEFCIADAGVICVFICFGCNEVKATIEST
jgi:hypothetical protein